MDENKDFYEPCELPDFERLWEQSANAVSSRAPVFDLSARVGELVSDEPENDEPEDVGSRRRRDARDFFKGFFAALAVMVPLCAGTLFIGYDPLGLDERARQASETVYDVPVAVTGGYTLLCAVRGGDGLLALSLLRADADAARVCFAELPLETVALDSGRPAALAEIWEVKGLSGVEAAVSGTLDVRLDGAAALDVDAVEALVDSLGGFRFSLDRDVVVYASGGLIQYGKHRGTSDFCGNDVKQLLLHAPHEGGELTLLRERMFAAAYEAAADGGLSSRIYEFCAEYGDDADGSVNSAGYYALTRTLSAACADGEGAFEAVRLAGAYAEDGRFELAEDSAERLHARYPKNSSSG